MAAEIKKGAGNQKKSNSAGRGGKRSGAGRKAGSLTKRTREVAEKAAEEGITPLEYMLKVMRQETTHEDPKVEIAREAMAFEAAKAAAPYMHPRLAAIEHSGPNGGAIPVERIERTIVDPANTDA